MELIEVIILGFVQGMTEFLPVSSSGHLVLVQALLGFDKPGVLLELVLHLGTSLAIVIYFRELLMSLSRRYVLLIVLGSAPAAFVGLIFRDFLGALFDSVRVVGFALLVTGVMNYLLDRLAARREKLSAIDALFVGAAQAVAIIPGISRSGATIFVGTFAGIKRERAAEFSFLLSVPAVVGANVLEFFTGQTGYSGNALLYFVGFLSAFVFGFGALGLVMRVLFARQFKIFGFWAITIGIIAIFLG